eukprot:3287609-Prymnesium_polylepis.1
MLDPQPPLATLQRRTRCTPSGFWSRPRLRPAGVYRGGGSRLSPISTPATAHGMSARASAITAGARGSAACCAMTGVARIAAAAA